MRARRLAPAVVLTAALAVTGCSSDVGTPADAAGGTPSATGSASSEPVPESDIQALVLTPEEADPITYTKTNPDFINTALKDAPTIPPGARI